MLTEFEILPIGIKEKAAINAFADIIFFPEEPLKVSLGIINDPIELERFPREVMVSGLSLKLVSKSGNLMGVALNKMLKSKSEEEAEAGEETKVKESYIAGSPEYNTYLIHEFLDYVEELIPFKNRNNAMEILVLAVEKNNRRKGMAGKLVEASVEIATEKKASGVLVICTSYYSACLFTKLEGFNEIVRVYYKDYLDSSGKQVFCTCEPHDSTRVFYLNSLSA